MEKRYYWLKLFDDFFDSNRIKKLRKLSDTFVIIYLKMQLKSLNTGGILTYTGLESTFAEELALDLHEQADDVAETLKYLIKHELCVKVDRKHYALPWVGENTGSETASTQRVRDYRKRQQALHCNENETQVKRTGNVDIDIEKDIDTDIDNRRTQRKKKRNAALNYAQTPIKEEDFEKLVVDLNKDEQRMPEVKGRSYKMGYANRIITMDQLKDITVDLNEEVDDDHV